MIFVFATVFGDVEAFRNMASFPARRTAVVHLAYSKLPSGISPFEKTSNPNVLADIRKIAAAAVTKALNDGETLIEVDFPPFLGQSKSQFGEYCTIPGCFLCYGVYDSAVSNVLFRGPILLVFFQTTLTTSVSSISTEISVPK